MTLKFSRQPVDGTIFNQLKEAADKYQKADPNDLWQDWFVPEKVSSLYTATNFAIVRHTSDKWWHIWFKSPTFGWHWYGSHLTYKAAKSVCNRWEEWLRSLDDVLDLPRTK